MKILLLALVLLPAATPAVAQGPRPGARVRIMSIADNREVKKGILVSLRGDTVVIETGLPSAPPTILQPGWRLEIGYREGRQTWRGIGIGLGVGVAVGAIIGRATYKDSCTNSQSFCLDFGAGMNTAAGAVVGGLGGALLGGAIGSSAGTDRWEPVVRSTPTARTAFSAPGRRVGFGISIPL